MSKRELPPVDASAIRGTYTGRRPSAMGGTEECVGHVHGAPESAEEARAAAKALTASIVIWRGEDGREVRRNAKGRKLRETARDDWDPEPLAGR